MVTQSQIVERIRLLEDKLIEKDDPLIEEDNVVKFMTQTKLWIFKQN
jgi:hypothetical protein